MRIYTDDELYELIPKHKSDISTMEELRNLSNRDFEKIGMEILEWFQDINWPIAREIRDLVVLKQDVMMAHILLVLGGNDECWKYWIITNILPELSEKSMRILLPKLIDMYDNPTPSELHEEVTEELTSFLQEKIYIPKGEQHE